MVCLWRAGRGLMELSIIPFPGACLARVQSGCHPTPHNLSSSSLFMGDTMPNVLPPFSLPFSVPFPQQTILLSLRPGTLRG